MQNVSRVTLAGGLIALAAIIGTLFYAARESNGPGKLDNFAKCLGDKGAKFYGAFWCPHCKNQKDLFGNSKRYLPYIECSTPNTQSQTDICLRNGIKSYPTWVFPDLSTTTGEASLAALADKTGCVLPADAK